MPIKCTKTLKQAFENQILKDLPKFIYPKPPTSNISPIFSDNDYVVCPQENLIASVENKLVILVRLIRITKHY